MGAAWNETSSSSQFNPVTFNIWLKKGVFFFWNPGLESISSSSLEHVCANVIDSVLLFF